MSEIERRAVLEVRAMGRQLAGLAAPYNVTTYVAGFDERIISGAFSESLRENGDVLALLDHDMTRVLARTKSGSLRLAESTRGLEFEIDLPGTSWANDALELVRSNNAGGMSFGFKVRKAGESWDGTTRELRALDLIEISVVSAFPAYSTTEVSARSKTPPRLARALRVLETV